MNCDDSNTPFTADHDGPTEEIGKDPSNTPIEELTAPLDPEDDAQERIALVNSSNPEDLRGASQ